MGRRAPGTALITGASSGIGAAAARQLAASGWSLALTGRDVGRLAVVAAACTALGAPRVTTAMLDQRDVEGITKFVAGLDRVDLFLASAGMLDGRREGAVIESAATAREVIETNLVGTIDTVHAVLARMREAGYGRIGLVSSLAAFVPLADAPAYSASKFGLLGYGMAMDEALRGEDVRISVICPGYVRTTMGTMHIGERPHEIDAEKAARMIIVAALKGKRLSGFPTPLYQLSRLSALAPPWLTRLVAGKLRFHVAR
jgi:short-subunit dehydrogenase